MPSKYGVFRQACERECGRWLAALAELAGRTASSRSGVRQGNTGDPEVLLILPCSVKKGPGSRTRVLPENTAR